MFKINRSIDYYNKDIKDYINVLDEVVSNYFN